MFVFVCLFSNTLGRKNILEGGEETRLSSQTDEMAREFEKMRSSFFLEESKC